MQDAYFKPDHRFYKIYANKTRDMHSLRTDDIAGAQPRRNIYDKAEIYNNYQQTINARKPVDPAKQSLNYWGGATQQGQQLQATNQSPTKYGATQSQSVKNIQVSRPEDYNLPEYYRVPGVNYQQLSQPTQPSYIDRKAQEAEERLRLVNQMRNPMFASYDPNKYYLDRATQNAPFGKYQDSLDNFTKQNQPQNYNQSPQVQNQPQSKQFKQDWMNFYGVETNPNAGKPVPNTQPITNKANPNYNSNAAAFYGERVSVNDQYNRNLANFFGVDENPKSQPPPRHTTKPNNNTNIFSTGPKDITVFNPLTQQPHARYQKGAKKFVMDKGPRSVKEEWDFKKNTEMFFD